LRSGVDPSDLARLLNRPLDAEGTSAASFFQRREIEIYENEDAALGFGDFVCGRDRVRLHDEFDEFGAG
jgi:hypothetical protein